MRRLGRTGRKVSILAFGGGRRFVQYGEEKGVEVLNRAPDLGINYIDTADSYGRNGESQVLIGKVLKGARPEAFVVGEQNPGADV